MNQSRRVNWPIARKLGKFAVVTGAAWLVASVAMLVLTGPSSGAVAAAATPSSTASAGCHPLSDEKTCYEPGEICRDTDHGLSGVAGDGKAIICEDNDGWRWEPLAGPAAPTASASPSATTSAPAGAPATGGGTGPGGSGRLAAAGGAIMVVGAGLVFLSRRRGRRMPV